MTARPFLDAPTQPVEVQPTREYVSGGTGLNYRHLRQLPPAFDRLTGLMGDDIYDEMGLDPKITACINVYKASILTNGMRLTPAVSDERKERYEQAVLIRDFCEAVQRQLDTPLTDVLWEMLDAVPKGHKLAEQVYEATQMRKLLPTAVGPGRPTTVLRLKALKVKPRSTYAFVQDAFDNTVGITPLAPAAYDSTAVRTGQRVTNVTEEAGQLLPRSKFFVYAFRPQNSDPRGTSALQPAYTPWWYKQQMLGEYLAYLSNFASGSVSGTTAPDALPDAEGTSAQELMLQDLLAWRNNYAFVGPNGSSVQVHYPDAGGGASFLNGFDFFNAEIISAIIHESLTIQEGQHMARAAAQVHQDTFAMILSAGRQSLALAYWRDVLVPLVAYNFGPDAVALTPTPSLGSVSPEDAARFRTDVASLMGADYFAPDQLPALDLMLDLPQRNAATTIGMLRNEQQRQDQQAQQTQPPAPAPAGESQRGPAGTQEGTTP